MTRERLRAVTSVVGMMQIRIGRSERERRLKGEVEDAG
jgi:hypothetical protein